MNIGFLLLRNTSEDENYRPVYKVIYSTDLLIKISSSKSSIDFYKELIKDENSDLRTKGILGFIEKRCNR